MFALGMAAYDLHCDKPTILETICCLLEEPADPAKFRPRRVLIIAVRKAVEAKGVQCSTSTGLVWQNRRSFLVLKQKRCLFICRPFCALMGELDNGFVGLATSYQRGPFPSSGMKPKEAKGQGHMGPSQAISNGSVSEANIRPKDNGAIDSWKTTA
jgi:hypothetical protein